MSPRDPDMSEPPIFQEGPFTNAERDAFLRGDGGGTRLAPHHRHQIPRAYGGVIDELPGPGHPAGNSHTGGRPTRHPARSIFRFLRFGEQLRQNEISEHFRTKGERLVEQEPGRWVDPGPPGAQ